MEFAIQNLPKVDIKSTENLKVGKKIRAEALKNWKGHIIIGTAVAVFKNKKLVGICKSLAIEPKKKDKGFVLQPVKVLI